MSKEVLNKKIIRNSQIESALFTSETNDELAKFNKNGLKFFQDVDYNKNNLNDVGDVVAQGYKAGTVINNTDTQVSLSNLTEDSARYEIIVYFVPTDSSYQISLSGNSFINDWTYRFDYKDIADSALDSNTTDSTGSASAVLFNDYNSSASEYSWLKIVIDRIQGNNVHIYWQGFAIDATNNNGFVEGFARNGNTDDDFNEVSITSTNFNSTDFSVYLYKYSREFN